MDKITKYKNYIEKLIYLKDDMPNWIRNIFSITEYTSYTIASFLVIYSVIITIINILKYMTDNNSKERKIYYLYKIRLITGQLLNISLTIILGGLIIRLLHITNLKTLLLIVITIMLKELIMSNIDKESSLVSKKIQQTKPQNIQHFNVL